MVSLMTKSKILGDHTEGATLQYLEAKNIDYLELRQDFKIIKQWNFTPDRKCMGTLGISPTTGGKIFHLKGAPELVLDLCTHILTEKKRIQPLADRSFIECQLKRCEERGLRTLGFAYMENPPENLDLDEIISSDTASCSYPRQSELKLIWIGLVAMSDPVRDDVAEAIASCQQAQIEVKMITGDHEITAKEIAKQVGLISEETSENSFLSGAEFRQLSDEEAKQIIPQLKVLYRARPKDKQRLVKLLQEMGQVVAVTGDGTNDAPALHQAQVGLAMGNSTSIAKDSSDIIILDHSFKSVENGVMWGRSLYQNIQKFILFQLTINVVACAIALLGPFIGINLPLTVIQLLWINLIMDTFAALALATEPPNPQVMNEPPRHPEAFIITPEMTVNIFTVAGIFLVFLVGFLLYIQQDQVVNSYELTLFFTTFVMLNFWNLFNAKSLGIKDSVLPKLASNFSFVAIALVILIGQVLMVQFGGDLFRTVALSWQDWLLIIGGTSVVFWVGELQRLLSRMKTS
jgi:Ca2+-transporting ATPase